MGDKKWMLAVSMALLAVPEIPVYAQAAYPARPVRLLIGAAPGGGLDVTARTMGPKLAGALGQ